MNEPKNLFADYVFESKDLASMFSANTARSLFDADGITWVVIPAGAFGNGCPLTSIEVVSEHLIPVSGALLEMWFGMPNAMIKAGHLIGQIDNIRPSHGLGRNSSTTRGPIVDPEGQHILSKDEVTLLLAMAADQEDAALQLGAAALADEDYAFAPRSEAVADAREVKKARRWV